jgi:DNA repair protein RecO (recombination protein O)
MGRNLDTVTEAQGLNSFRAVREDLQRVSMGLYIAELTDAFSTEGAAGYSLFHRTLRTLSWLESAQNPDLLVRHFEMHLLVDSGYEPEIINCVECREKLEPAEHLFAPMSGGALCPSCRKHSNESLIPLSMNAMKVLRFLRRESRYDKVDGLEVAPSLVSEMERLLRNYTRFILEKDLKSAEFMNLVR